MPSEFIQKENFVTRQVTFANCTLGQKSSFYPKIHMFKKSHFSRNSQFQNRIISKIHIFKTEFFTKISFSKSQFSQKSHFRSQFSTSCIFKITFFTKVTLFLDYQNQVNLWTKSVILPQCVLIGQNSNATFLVMFKHCVQRRQRSHQ